MIILGKSKTNHPNTRLLRKVFMKRMILPALAEGIILSINILRKRFINHSLSEITFFRVHDLSLQMIIGVLNHPPLAYSSFSLVREYAV
jgi:hypothetical protein